VDKIIIKDLEVDAHIGVSDAERAQPQRLLVTLELERDLVEAGSADSEAATTRYDLVANMIRDVVGRQPRKLVETVAAEIAEAILHHKFAAAVGVEVKKFSVPRSRYVSVQIRRAL
jgi:dihydroneopterin aldolase